LCIARLNQTNGPYKDSIEIQQSLYDTIMRVFAIMNNMQPSSLKDTLKGSFFFTNFSYPAPIEYESDSSHIHTVGSGTSSPVNSVIFDVTRIKYFSIVVDTGLAWVKQWAIGNYTNSTNSAIDSFINKYVVSITKSPLIFFGNQYKFTLKIAPLLNINALIKSFSNIITTTFIFPGKYAGGGNTLIFDLKDSGVIATFANGCGDCPSGCTYYQNWYFYIPYDSCIVRYIGSDFTGSSSPNICLRGGSATPIEFGNITATKQVEQNQINFTSLTEVNIKKYQIERSSNANNFVTINSLAAHNKNNSSYTVVDKNPLRGNNYYRVKAIENDGTVSYSKTVLVKNDDIKINMYPNPAHNYFIVESPQMKQINILDRQGKIVFAKALNNTNVQKINTSQLSKELYFVQVINNGGEIKTRKIMVE
jgi:Secretion system C-terminal sorting domain